MTEMVHFGDGWLRGLVLQPDSGYGVVAWPRPLGTLQDARHGLARQASANTSLQEALKRA